MQTTQVEAGPCRAVAAKAQAVSEAQTGKKDVGENFSQVLELVCAPDSEKGTSKEKAASPQKADEKTEDACGGKKNEKSGTQAAPAPLSVMAAAVSPLPDIARTEAPAEDAPQTDKLPGGGPAPAAAAAGGEIRRAGEGVPAASAEKPEKMAPEREEKAAQAGAGKIETVSGFSETLAKAETDRPDGGRVSAVDTDAARDEDSGRAGKISSGRAEKPPEKDGGRLYVRTEQDRTQPEAGETSGFPAEMPAESPESKAREDGLSDVRAEKDGVSEASSLPAGTRGEQAAAKEASGGEKAKSEIRAQEAAQAGAPVHAGAAVKPQQAPEAPQASGENRETAGTGKDQPVFQTAEAVAENAAEGEGRSEFKLKLRPEGLGEVSVTMECAKGRVSLQVSASVPETGRLLESRTDVLKTALADRNLELVNVEVHSGSTPSGGAGSDFRDPSGDGRAWRPESVVVRESGRKGPEPDFVRYVPGYGGKLDCIA